MYGSRETSRTCRAGGPWRSELRESALRGCQPLTLTYSRFPKYMYCIMERDMLSFGIACRSGHWPVKGYGRVNLGSNDWVMMVSYSWETCIDPEAHFYEVIHCVSAFSVHGQMCMHTHRNTLHYPYTHTHTHTPTHAVVRRCFFSPALILLSPPGLVDPKHHI